MTDRRKERDENRRKYPDVAGFVDDLRAHFGEISVLSLEAKDER